MHVAKKKKSQHRKKSQAGEKNHTRGLTCMKYIKKEFWHKENLTTSTTDTNTTNNNPNNFKPRSSKNPVLMSPN